GVRPREYVGMVTGWKVAPVAAVATEAVVGAVLSSAKVAAAPVNVLPARSVAVACTAYVPSVCKAHVGKVALLVHDVDPPPGVAAWVVARLATPDCQVAPFQ